MAHRLLLPGCLKIPGQGHALASRPAGLGGRAGRGLGGSPPQQTPPPSGTPADWQHPSPAYQPINQCTLLVFRTLQGSQQTIIGKTTYTKHFQESQQTITGKTTCTKHERFKAFDNMKFSCLYHMPSTPGLQSPTNLVCMHSLN